MRRRELLGLVALSVALWLTLSAISSAVAGTLPGREAQRRWLVRALGMGDAELAGLDRSPRRSSWGCSTILVLLFGVPGVLLVMSGGRSRRREIELLEEGELRSEAALWEWIERRREGALTAEEAGREHEAALRRGLVEPFRWIFDRALVLLASPAALSTSAPPGWPRRRRWARLVSEAFLVTAVVALATGVSGGFTLAPFDEVPELGMPLGPSTVFDAVAFGAVAACAWAFLAFGLRRLDDQAARFDARRLALRRDAPRKLLEALVLAPADGGRCTTGVDRAFGMAALEAAHPDDRSCPWAAVEPAGRDGWAVGAEISSLLLLYAAVLLGAGFCYLAGLWAHIPLGWFRSPENRQEELFSSPLGAAILATPFFLATTFLLGLAWVLRRSAVRPLDPAPATR